MRRQRLDIRVEGGLAILHDSSFFKEEYIRIEREFLDLILSAGKEEAVAIIDSYRVRKNYLAYIEQLAVESIANLKQDESTGDNQNANEESVI